MPCSLGTPATAAGIVLKDSEALARGSGRDHHSAGYISTVVKHVTSHIYETRCFLEIVSHTKNEDTPIETKPLTYGGGLNWVSP